MPSSSSPSAWSSSPATSARRSARCEASADVAGRRRVSLRLPPPSPRGGGGGRLQCRQLLHLSAPGLFPQVVRQLLRSARVHAGVVAVHASRGLDRGALRAGRSARVRRSRARPLPGTGCPERLRDVAAAPAPDPHRGRPAPVLHAPRLGAVILGAPPRPPRGNGALRDSHRLRHPLSLRRRPRGGGAEPGGLAPPRLLRNHPGCHQARGGRGRHLRLRHLLRQLHPVPLSHQRQAHPTPHRALRLSQVLIRPHGGRSVRLCHRGGPRARARHRAAHGARRVRRLLGRCLLAPSASTRSSPSPSAPGSSARAAGAARTWLFSTCASSTARAPSSPSSIPWSSRTTTASPWFPTWARRSSGRSGSPTRTRSPRRSG